MAHAFSDLALREQEPLIQSYCDLLIEKLDDQIAGPNGVNVDIVSWFNFTTFVRYYRRPSSGRIIQRASGG